jgi:predicted extracellular nuclease
MGIDNITIYGVGVAGNVPPTVVNTDPSDGAEYVNVNSNIEITFSETVTSTGAWFEIVCDATIVPAVASGGPTSYTLDPTSDLPSTAACTVTVLASQVTDQGDPPLNMEQDYSFGFTTNAVCGDPATIIHAVQGPGAISPIIGQIVTVEGVVVGDFQESDELNGFFVQEENADFDGDINTSEGLFIFEDSYDGPDINEGDLVRVTGQVDEYYTLTELNNIANVLLCEYAPGPYGPVNVTLPETTDGDLEWFEGMYVNVSNSMSVAQNYFLGRYGQLTLSSDLTNRLYQPTNQVLPNTPESFALADYNARNLLILDDGVDVNTCGDNPVPVPYLGPAPPAILRSGDYVSNLIGVLDYGQINSGSQCWVPSTLGRDYRLQPTQDPVFSTENPRTTVPDAVGGNLKVAAFNVLNYFTTLDTGSDICGPLGDQECRGADTASEFTRQRDKIIAALVAIDADVVGLIEIENYPGDVPIADLVSGLNDVMGAGTYNYVATGAIGDDAIRVGLIYKPANVSLVGGFAVLDDPAFTDPLGYGEEKSRPALAQTFMDVNTGGTFTAVVNHLKSKGSACGPGDDDPEQGNCNLTRALGAQALVDWLLTDPTGSGDPDMMILGDLNAYAMEDPVQTLEDNGFTNLVKAKALNGDYAYSYTFDGMVGTLDYSLANSSLASQVNSATIWHINTDEPAVIDYDENYNPPGYYSSDAYRSSDHDPVVIGLVMTTEQEVNELIDAVQALVDDGTLKKGRGKALVSKLENVLAKLAKEKFNAAANQLNAFINQVEAFVNAGILTAEQGDALIEAAAALVGVLSD